VAETYSVLSTAQNFLAIMNVFACKEVINYKREFSGFFQKRTGNLSLSKREYPVGLVWGSWLSGPILKSLVDRPSHLKIPGGPKMASAALSSWTIDGSCAA